MQAATNQEINSEQYVQNELVRFLYEQSRGAVLGGLVAGFSITYGLYGTVPNLNLLAWTCSILLVSCLRMLSGHFYQRRATPSATAKWYWLFVGITVFGALNWTYLGTVLLVHDLGNQVLITLALAIVTSYSILLFAPSRLAASAFLFIIMPAFAIRSYAMPGPIFQVVSYLVFAYQGVLLVSVFRLHRYLREALLLQFEKDGLIKHISITKNALETANAALTHEIFERKGVENLLRESETQYRLVTDALPVLIAYIDKDMVFRFNNKAYSDWFDQPLTAITGKPVEDILGDMTANIYKDYLPQLRQGKTVAYESAIQTPDDNEHHVSVTLIPDCQQSHLKGIFALISDLTPRLNHLALHDSLTNLPNRRLFMSRLMHHLKIESNKQEKLALLFLDLDHFKDVNDTLGHDVGDALLIKVVERIQQAMEEQDILARLGGDEFTLILSGSESVARVESLARTLCQSLSRVFHIRDRDVFISTSIGISVFPYDGLNAATLLKNADLAMYHAKDHGRNTYRFFTQAMAQTVQRKQSIELALRHALVLNELKLHYQPIVDIQSNRLLSAEALLRWQHPQLGEIKPSEFIPIAEASDLIVPIGEWVLRTACKQAKIWHTHGVRDVAVAVNISPRQFMKSDLLQLVTQVLRETNLEGRHLILEITENVIMEDIDHSLRLLKALKNLQVTISIDDFGTGYSSLSYLKRFPFDIVKIDRTFLTNFSANEEDAAIVRAIIAMAHSLKMQVIAEGVETPEQYLFLKEHGCDAAQGYFFHSPMPEAELSLVLTQQLSEMVT